MKLITKAELVANARKAYDERRLTAQQEREHAQCVYSLRINDRDCYCVIGASLPPKMRRSIVEGEANEEPIKRLIRYRLLPIELESEDFAEDLQRTYDDWCAAVQEDQPPEHAERQFLELIGHPSASRSWAPERDQPTDVGHAAVADLVSGRAG
jgi:hypothetical protein